MTAGRRADGTQRQWRGHARELAGQPAGNHPRQMASDTTMDFWYGITTGSPPDREFSHEGLWRHV